MVVKLVEGMLAFYLRERGSGCGYMSRESFQEYKNVQSSNGERGHCLVETADHDASVIVPCCTHAMVAECPA